MSDRSVLVVDDNSEIRMLVRACLELTPGWTVRDVGSGAEALAAAAADRPDLVVLDVMMPEMDGPEVLARLQADPLLADVPVVFLTARTDEALHARLCASGARGVLTKPFDALSLGSTLGDLVDATVSSR